MSKEAISLGVLYKNLIGRLKELIIKPQQEWRLIFSEGKSINEVLTQFSLPLIGIYTLTVFLGYLMSHQELDFESALKEAVFTFSSGFFGLYVCYYFFLKLMAILKKEVKKEEMFQLVAYSSSIMYLSGSVVALIPEAIIIGSIVNLYLVYLVWIGLGALNRMTKDVHVWMTIIFGLIILILPSLIHRLFVFISNLTV
ncbi:MAG: YIP1 family protein [Carboxylicivirga sp.]|jgi:hypothetical protein|nr:YIP1 family protein [Carboxylicivirga sp.]